MDSPAVLRRTSCDPGKRAIRVDSKSEADSKGTKASDRRVHRRVDTAELPVPARVSIPNRPAITLVDLSSGGALLELPFQLQPDARVSLRVWTPDQKLVVPFKLLRCYVAGIKGRVRYHAAGAFEATLALPGLADDAPPTPVERLITTLEMFLQSTNSSDATGTAAGFHQLIAWVIEGLRRGDSARLIAMKIKAHLAQQFPSLAISPSSDIGSRDARTSARFFGYDFRSQETLTRSDRRVLRAGAQMIALLDAHARSEMTADSQSPYQLHSPPPMIVHNIADWDQLRQSA